jgi:thiol:disulfide interchange protein DsbA
MQLRPFIGLLAATLLAACSQSPTPQTTAEPTAAAAPAEVAAPAPAPVVAAAPVADPAPVASATGEDAPSRSETALEKIAALPAQDQLPAGQWKPGVNYKPLVPAQPTSVTSGKVEVAEVFWYGCGHCYSLDPFLESWKKNKPAYIEFVRIPVMWGAVHKSHAKLFYTMQALGRDKDLHTKIFDAIHRAGNGLVGNDEDSTYKAQLEFAKANGISEADFSKAYNSFGVATAMQRATQLTRSYQVEGVPLMVVNGKYVTDVGMAGGHSNLLALLNSLAAAEKRR